MKKIFLFGIVFVFLFIFISVSVNAFNVTGISHLFPLSNATDMNTNSSVVLDSVSGVTYNTGLYQNALNCSDLNEYLGTITNAEADKFQTGNYWSWTVWAKPTTNTSAQRQILGTEGGYGFGTNAAGKITAHIGDSVTALVTCASGNVSMTLNTWEFYTITVDLTTKTQKFYHNGSFVCSNTYTNNYEYGGATSKFKFCVEAGGTAWDFIGLVDEAYYFDRVLTLNEITELYNNGKGKFAWDFIGEIGGVKPSIILLSELKNGTVTNSTNFNFYFNQTSVNNSNDYFCGVYENTTLKNSINETITGNKNLSFSLLGDYERYLNFTIRCFNDNATGELSALYYVDNVKSVLDYAYPNGTYYNDEALYTNFSVTDTNLYSIEWLLYQGATLKENISHKNIVGGSYAVYNLSAVSQITGNYNWILNVWENHNPLTSPDLFSEYDPTIEKSTGEITYSKEQKNYTIQSKELLDVATETKDLKQYFTFTPDLKTEQPKFYTYYLKSLHFIDYIKESQYKGHFVIWDLKRYVDFQCDDYVNVFKETDYLYRIETPCTKFETTGNLNFQQFTGNFTITTPPSLSDEYLLSLNETMTNVNNNLINITMGINMIPIILLPVIFGLFCLIGAATMGTHHDVLKTALFLLSLVTVLGSIYLGSVMISTTSSAVQDALGVTQTWIGYAIFVIIIYFLLYIIYKGFQLAAQKKQEKIEY